MHTVHYRQLVELLQHWWYVLILLDTCDDTCPHILASVQFTHYGLRQANNQGTENPYALSHCFVPSENLPPMKHFNTDFNFHPF